MSDRLTRADVERICREAWERDQRPDLHEADLNGADLRWANLRGANLSGADLNGADLSGARWDGLYVDGLHPYRCLLVPTPDGWQVTIGCWSGTVTELRDLIAQDDDWPEADGNELLRRRPLLAAFADLCDAHIAGRPNVITDLAQRWAATTTDLTGETND